MVYFQNELLIVRSMLEEDIEKLVKGFAEQKWNKPYELFENYFNLQTGGQRRVIVAEVNGEVAGYVTLLSSTDSGPFANKGIPEIVDFNVLIKYQRRGIGNKIMDVVESIAKETSKYVSLAVGLHYGYGSAQRMYVKRGYIPDGSGVWYQGERLEQYVECINDDDLNLYMLKDLK